MSDENQMPENGVYVYYDERGEVQVATSTPTLTLHEMELMFEAAAAKLRLLQWKLFERNQKEKKPDIIVPKLTLG